MLEGDLGGAEAVVVGGVVEDFIEGFRGALGDPLGALVGGFDALGAGVGEGGLEVGVFVSPAPEGFGVDVEELCDSAPAVAVEGELDSADLGVGEAVAGVEIGEVGRPRMPGDTRKCPIFERYFRTFPGLGSVRMRREHRT